MADTTPQPIPVAVNHQQQPPAASIRANQQAIAGTTPTKQAYASQEASATARQESAPATDLIDGVTLQCPQCGKINAIPETSASMQSATGLVKISYTADHTCDYCATPWQRRPTTPQ